MDIQEEVIKCSSNKFLTYMRSMDKSVPFLRCEQQLTDINTPTHSYTVCNSESLMFTLSFDSQNNLMTDK